MMEPTTAWLQTPPGRAGIAVVCLAGPRTGDVLGRVFRPARSQAGDSENILRLGYLVDGDVRIDEAIVSRRGRTAEINIHGGSAVAAAVLKLLGRCDIALLAARPAAPESFPLAHPRWNNPAIGMEMLEALAGARSLRVASAVTEQWSGGISRLAREALNATRPPENVPADLQAAADAFPTMRRMLQPAEVVLAGPPNAGKSLLANALIGRQVSIVDATAGTTRDWVRELAVLNGIPIWLTDTAGLWDVPQGVDAEAVRRARRRAEQADLVLLLGVGGPVSVPEWLHARKLLRVGSQCDRCPPDAAADVAVSAVTGQGMDQIKAAIVRALNLAEVRPTRPMAFTRRQERLLRESAESFSAGRTDQASAALSVLLEDTQAVDVSGATGRG